MNGRRSSRVRLVALGTVVIGGCSGDDIPMNRYVYANRPACVTEWGERNCEAGRASGGTSVGVGPRYGSWVNLPSGEKVYSGTPQTPSFHPQTGKHLGAGAMSVARTGSAGGTARGGFGSTGFSHSSGG